MGRGGTEGVGTGSREEEGDVLKIQTPIFTSLKESSRCNEI